MEQHKNTLSSIELFQDLTEDQLQRVQMIATEHKYARGDYVFMEGQKRENVYFVERGLIKIFRVDEEGREHIVNILGASQMFPHVGFFDDSPYPGTAEAISSSHLIAISSTKFEVLLNEDVEIARSVMRMMGKMILQLQAKLRELALFDARERVGALVRHFAEEYGQLRSDGIHVKLPVTHSELAHMIGMSRESVNRIWNEMRREGLLAGDKEEWIVDKNWYTSFISS